MGGVWETLEEDNEINVLEAANVLDFQCQPCEVRAPKTLWDPLLPTPLEVAEHNLTHRPYRRWCKICIAAWGREDPHKRGGGKV